MNQSYWRNRAAPIIAKVLADTKGQPESAIKKALHDAYPFGMRKYHPYKMWLQEIRFQRGGGTYQSDYTKLAEWEAIYGKREALQ